MVRDIRGLMNRCLDQTGERMSRSNRREDVLSAWQPRGGSNVHTFIPLVGLTENQRLLERLETENTQLHGSVVDLLSQLQTFLTAARYLLPPPRSATSLS